MELGNRAYHLTLTPDASGVHARLEDLRAGFLCADAPYLWRAARRVGEDSVASTRLRDAKVAKDGDALRVTGRLAGLALEQTFRLPADRPIMEEHLVLRNRTEESVDLQELRTGFQHPIVEVVEGFTQRRPQCNDRFAAVPLRHHALSPRGVDVDFSIQDMMVRLGDEGRLCRWQAGCIPEMHWASEAWVWLHGGHALLIGTYSQEAIEFSVLALYVEPEVREFRLVFGGTSTVGGDPRRLEGIGPGESRSFGLTRYETVSGGHSEACKAYRDFLDSRGCRFPAGFDPPVHWNELFDNPEWGLWHPGPLEPGRETWAPRPPETRKVTYTRKMMEIEAAKAAGYGCQTLYLDPGWDTDFGSFLWAADRLGPCAQFVQDMEKRHGLKTAVHLATAPWMSNDARAERHRHWPQAARCRDAEGVLTHHVCLGSKPTSTPTWSLPGGCTTGIRTSSSRCTTWWRGGRTSGRLPCTTSTGCREATTRPGASSSWADL